MKVKAIILMIILFAIAVPQFLPRSAQEPSTCQMEKAKAESQAAAAKTESEVKSLRIQQLLGQISTLKENEDTAVRNLAVEQKTSAELSISIQGVRQEVKEANQEINHLRLTNLSLTSERDQLARKIKNANGRWTCEVLHIGCIGER